AYKPLSGPLSARPILVDGTQSNAWGPALCPACSAPTLTRLLATASPLQQPRDPLAGRQRRLTCAVASAESSTEPTAHGRGWGTGGGDVRSQDTCPLAEQMRWLAMSRTAGDVQLSLKRLDTMVYPLRQKRPTVTASETTR